MKKSFCLLAALALLLSAACLVGKRKKYGYA